MSSSSASSRANFLLDIEFEVNGYTINGAYSTTSGMLVGKVEDVNLKALAPDDITAFIPDITIDSVVAVYNTKTNDSYLKTDLGLNLTLHDLPFIGSRIPQADNFGLICKLHWGH